MMQHIAHELRTPLTTMMTAHYVLVNQRMGPLNTEQLRLLSAIRQNIDRLTDFSYDFLDLAKIEAGMMRFNVERTDPTTFVEPLVEEARLTASEKEISVRLVTDHAPDVLIDRKRFSHVITNLLSNAIKYSNRRGTITVAVTSGQIGTSISVTDTGIGIAEEDLPRVFEKFYRARWAGGKGTRGTGVGLALVKAIVEGHGGRVGVTSSVGVGSTFTVEIPSAPHELREDALLNGRNLTEIGRG
jgi:signal transduction histidine kinase